MAKQHTHHVTIKRVLFMGIVQAFLLMVIIGRLYILQVLHSEKYAMLSDDNRIRTRSVLPRRGEILDRRGRVLAKNIDNYRVEIIPEDTKDLEGVLERLASILKLGEKELYSIKKSLKQKKRFMPTTVKDALTWDQLSKIEVNTLSLPGVYIVQGYRRHYPLGKSVSHVLGYVSSPNEEEVQNNKTLILPGAKVGKSALEVYYEPTLRGEVGRREVEVDASGRIIREITHSSPAQGQDLHLSLDEDLQAYILELFEEKNVESGAAIVMDIHTGEVLSFVSVPGFDPDVFYHGIDSKSWRNLLQDPYKPITNKVISGQYSPASIFKIIVALAALEEGHLLEEVYTCPGYHYVGNHKFHCWKKGGHGPLNLYQSLVKSCDVYFYQLARKLGEKPILKMAERFGLKTSTGIDLPGEAVGFLANPQWKKRVRQESWYLGDTILTAIGQAYVLNTPIQMALMMAQVANGGWKVVPTLVKGGKKRKSKRLRVSSRSLKAVRDALSDAVNTSIGTSFRSRIQNPKHAMGGKTGTAQVRRISMAERVAGIRKDKDIPWHLRDNSLFVGFAPVQKPQYVVAIVAEHKGFGGVVAAPLGGRILEKVQQIMGQ